MDGREELIRLLLDCGAVRFGEFTLASGAKSDVYRRHQDGLDPPRARARPDRRSTRETSRK